jgi:hypothetical protein
MMRSASWSAGNRPATSSGGACAKTESSPRLFTPLTEPPPPVVVCRPGFVGVACQVRVPVCVHQFEVLGHHGTFVFEGLLGPLAGASVRAVGKRCRHQGGREGLAFCRLHLR